MFGVGVGRGVGLGVGRRVGLGVGVIPDGSALAVSIGLGDGAAGAGEPDGAVGNDPCAVSLTASVAPPAGVDLAASCGDGVAWASEQAATAMATRTVAIHLAGTPHPTRTVSRSSSRQVNIGRQATRGQPRLTLRSMQSPR